MSNYMVIVHEKALDGLVDKWLSARGGIEGADVIRSREPQHYSMCFIAHEVASSYSPAGDFFKGNLIDYDGGKLVFGLPGLKRWRDTSGRGIEAEGQFVHVEWNERLVRVSHDLFGSVAAMYSSGTGYVAISDSLAAIADFRRFVGDSCDLNREVLLSRAVMNNIAHQQIGVETPIRQVLFLPATKGLAIDTEKGIVARQVGESVIDQFHWAGSYREGLRSAAMAMARLLRTLTGLEGWQVNLALSGGYDSRAVLGAAIAADVLDNIDVKCRNENKSQYADFLSASILSSVFGFELNKPSSVAGVSARVVDCTPLGLWGLSSAGIYDGFTFRRTAPARGNAINLNGIGAELSRGNYGWKSWKWMADGLNAPEAVLNAFYSQGVAGLDALGADPTSEEATEWHYLGYRHGLHGGRSSALGMTGFMPLASRRLVSVGRSIENVHKRPLKEGPSVISDLIALLSPTAALLPYDRDGKTLAFSHVSERFEALGRGLGAGEILPFEILGSPQNVPAGPPAMFLDLSRASGIDVPLTQSKALELAEEGLTVLEGDAELYQIYEKVLKRAKWRLIEKKAPLIGGVPEAGKLVALRSLLA